MVAVDDFAGMVDEKTTIAVAIVGDAEVEVILGDKFLKGLEVSGAALVIDFGIIVRVVVDKSDFCAELFEDLLIDDASGTVGAVHGEVEIFETGFSYVFEEMGGIEGEGFGMDVVFESDGS